MRALLHTISDAGDRLLIQFDRWFASKSGVYHTFLITLIIVIAEFLFPTVDPHGFWLLYYLTVYSAVTQPALAHTAQEAAEQNKELLAKLDIALAHLSLLAEKEDEELLNILNSTRLPPEASPLKTPST